MNLKISDSIATLAAIGALAPIVASLSHEALGHGAGCLIDGGRITLLTFLVFRCAGAGAIADGGGPVGIFVVACLALVATTTVDRRSTTLRVFLLTLGAMGLLWFWAQMVRDSGVGTDDWEYTAAALGWPGSWHALACGIGAVGYVVTVRIVGRIAPNVAEGRPSRLLIPYVAAALSAVALGALWHGDRAASALDGFLSFGVAPLGYLLIIRRTGRRAPASEIVERVERSTALIAASAALWVSYALTIARGVGRLAY